MAENYEFDSNLVSKLLSSNKSADFIDVLETVIREYRAREKIHNVPISIFSNRKLGVLESIVKYLKENNMTYSEIALLLNRDDRTIWATYHKAVAKEKEILPVIDSITIDPSIFSNRKQAPLEALVKHLKEKGLTTKKISVLLNRSYKTIWLTNNKKSIPKNET